MLEVKKVRKYDIFTQKVKISIKLNAIQRNYELFI